MRFIIFFLAMTQAIMLQAQETNISGGPVFEGEPYLAVNPSNARHMVVAWIGYVPAKPSGIKTKVTFDAGKTWSKTVVLPHFASTHKSADPSLAFDNTGNVYACYIDYRESPDSGGIYVVKSTDGGLSWGNASKVIDAYADGLKKPIDRPWLSVNPVNNHMYITSKPAPWILPPNRPYFMASVNAGVNWKPWRYLDTAGFYVGSAIMQPMAAISTAADGTVHCMYPSWVISQNTLPGFIHARSSSDGATFTYHGAAYAVANKSDSLAKLGSRLAADPSDPAHLAFFFPLNKHGDIDVWMVETFDKGDTWSAPVRINDDAQNNGKLQDLIWADFDKDGDLAVAWRDRRKATGTGYETASQIWGAIRWKDSSAFSHNVIISDTLVPYNGLYLSQSGNDFMCLDMSNDTLSAVWGDVRSGQLNIWFSRRDTKSGYYSGLIRITSESLPVVEVFPNPGNGILHLKGDKVSEAKVYDMSGRQLLDVKPDADAQTIDISMYPPNYYMLYLYTENGAVAFKIKKD